MCWFPIITCFIKTGEGECSVCSGDVYQCDRPQWPGQQHRPGGGDDAGLRGEWWQSIGQKSRYTYDKFLYLIHASVTPELSIAKGCNGAVFPDPAVWVPIL